MNSQKYLDTGITMYELDIKFNMNKKWYKNDLCIPFFHYIIYSIIYIIYIILCFRN